MKEIINLSLSQLTNHLNTHFYNGQENYIDYTSPEPKDDIDLNVYNESVISGANTMSYRPRAILWDMKNGFGNLDLTESYDEILSHRSETIYKEQGIESWERKIQTLSIGAKPTKSDFQIALDNNAKLPRLNNQNTFYWSDYSCMIFEPKRSFNTLNNWQINRANPKGELRVGTDSKGFEDFEMGVQDWGSVPLETQLDNLDTKFRAILESCDNFQGLNVSLEVDSGWAGYYSELIPTIKDEYLSKKTLFSWGLCENTLKPARTMTRIKAMLSMIDNSDLVLPISVPQNLHQLLNVDKTVLDTNYGKSSVFDVAFDTLLTLFAHTNSQLTMQDFQMQYTWNSNRNLITDLQIHNKFDSTIKLGVFDSADALNSQDQRYFFNKTVISRGVVDSDKVGNFEDTVLAYGVTRANLKKFNNALSFNEPSSWPDWLKGKNDMAVLLQVSNSPRKSLQKYSSIAKRVLYRDHDEKEEMVEKLETLASEYEVSFDVDFDDWD